MFSLDSLILQGAAPASRALFVCLFFLRNFQVGFDKYLVCIYILANPSASQWLVHQTQVSKHRATSICSNCISSHPFPVIFHFKSEPQGSLLISKWVIETPGEPLIKSCSSAVFQPSTRICWTRTMNSLCSQPLLDKCNKVTWNSCQCHIFLQLYQLYHTSLFYRGHKPCSLTKCIYVTFIGKQTPTGWRLKGCRRCIMMIFSCHKCVTGKSMCWQYESYPNICLCQKASKCFPSHMNWQYRHYHNGTCKL